MRDKGPPQDSQSFDKGGSSPFVDPLSQAGKWHAPREHFEIVVVGAGPAGVAAAIAAAEAGASVMLVDEHPVAGELAGLDVPYFFGGRAGAALGNAQRMLEQLLMTNPRLEAVFELGVDVRLGTVCWGAFVPGPNFKTLPKPVVGLADANGSSIVAFDRLILATGARDLVLFFDGADQPGVMGAQGFDALTRRYEAFEGRRLLILGSGDLALSTAERALALGLEVAGLVEVRDVAQGEPDRVAALAERSVPVITQHVIRQAGRGIFGVTNAELVSLIEGADDIVIDCDTIVLAVDLVPVVELVDVAGAKLSLDPVRGGYVPRRMGHEGATTLPQVFVAGDCAGLVSDAEAEAQGSAAASIALASLKAGWRAPEPAALHHANAGDDDCQAYRLDWMRALLAIGSTETLACQCEEVTRGQLLGVRPPRYLGEPGPAFAPRSLATLAADGPIDQDQIKRLTRACMGACQARRCREQVAMMLAIGADIDLAEVPLAGYRAPVRPLPLAILADAEEAADMRAGWDVWFGIRTQWVPYEDIGTERETAFLGHNMHL